MTQLKSFKLVLYCQTLDSLLMRKILKINLVSSLPRYVQYIHPIQNLDVAAYVR